MVDLRIWGKSRGLAGESEPAVVYPLVCHLLDSAAMMAAIWHQYLSSGLRRYFASSWGMSDEECRRFLMFLAAVHDIGKACPGFQDKVGIPDGYPLTDAASCRDHALAGHLWLTATLHYKLGYDEDLAVRVGEVVGAHHGVFSSLERNRFKPASMHAKGGLGGGLWGQQRMALLTMVRELLGRPVFPKQIPFDAVAVACAAVTLADWLASRVEYVRTQLDSVPAAGDVDSLRAFFDGALERCGGELDRMGLRRMELRPGSVAEEFAYIQDFLPRRLQSSLDHHLSDMVNGAGVLIVTEEAGAGKTEAGLFGSRVMGQAAGTAGLAFLLPTMATSNAMETRMASYLRRRAAGPAALNLVHSMAWLRRLRQEEASDTEIASEAADMVTVVSEWLSGGKKAAHAPGCVATVDQALLSVLPLRHNAFRMLAFANKTIVIDEVHAFDSYVYRLLEIFLSWCGKLGVPVILMSATLPQSVGQRLAAAYLGERAGTALPIDMSYPGWTFIDLDTHKVSSKEVVVAESDHEVLRIERASCPQNSRGMERLGVLQQKLRPLLDSFGSAAIICTTVNEAQYTYRDLQKWLASSDAQVELVLLHANMPLWQRERITDQITARFGKNGDRNGRTIIVSTQVIEQSLDIDMDLLISDLAPLELLIQRAGRERRHRDNDSQRPDWADRNRLVVLVPEGDWEPAMPKRWEWVYPLAALIRTHRLLVRDTDEGIRIPGDVQRLVDTLHDDPELIAGHERAATMNRAAQIAMQNEADRISIPRPDDLTVIAPLSKGSNVMEEEAVSTRFNADSIRALPVFQRDGEYYLDPRCQSHVPQANHVRGKATFSRNALATIIEHTVPVRQSYISPEHGDQIRPADWQQHHLLNRVVPLIHHIDADGAIAPVTISEHRFYLDPQLGLTIDWY